MCKTLGDVVREEAAKHGIEKLSDDNVEYIIWEHTGYPSFWDSNNFNSPEECFKSQIKDYFNNFGKWRN